MSDKIYKKKRDIKLQIRINEDEKDLLKEICSIKDKSMSDVVRESLVKYFELIIDNWNENGYYIFMLHIILNMVKLWTVVRVIKK